jgi:hypothetical protein
MSWDQTWAWLLWPAIVALIMGIGGMAFARYISRKG